MKVWSETTNDLTQRLQLSLPYLKFMCSQENRSALKKFALFSDCAAIILAPFSITGYTLDYILGGQ